MSVSNGCAMSQPHVQDQISDEDCQLGYCDRKGVLCAVPTIMDGSWQKTCKAPLSTSTTVGQGLGMLVQNDSFPGMIVEHHSCRSTWIPSFLAITSATLKMPGVGFQRGRAGLDRNWWVEPFGWRKSGMNGPCRSPLPICSGKVDTTERESCHLRSPWFQVALAKHTEASDEIEARSNYPDSGGLCWAS